MTDPKDRPTRGRPPGLPGDAEPDDLELIEDEDILAGESEEDEDLAEEVATGKLDVPSHIRRKLVKALPGGGEPLGEDPFEEITGEAEVGPQVEDGLLDDEDFEGMVMDDQTPTSDLKPQSAGSDPAGDTMEEPVSRRRRSRRRSRLNGPAEPAEPERDVPRPAAETAEPPPWNQQEQGLMYQEDTDSSWTPGEGAADAPAPAVAPTKVEHAADPAQEKTLIFGEGGESGKPEFPFLVVVRGEEEGREIELTQNQITMGRGADNDLVFPDIACSRRHCILERRNGDFFVTDLGSGNGTVVNGSRVQSAVLKDGDEIEIGSTILQFNLPGRAGAQRGGAVQTVTSTHPVPTESKAGPLAGLLADPRRKKLIVYGGGGVIGFLFLMLLVKAISGSSQPPPPSPEELRRQEQLRVQQELDEHMQEAKRLVKEKQWAQAQLSVQLALKLDPSNRFALDYRDFIAREVSAQTALQTARSFIEQKAWDEAIAALNQIGNQSLCFEEAAALKNGIEQDLITDLIAQGRALMEEKNFNQALLKFDDVLRRDPGHQDAAALKRAVEEEIAKEETRVAKLEKAKKRKSVTFKKKKEPAKKKSSLTGQVLAFYKNGEIDRAIEKAESSGATESLVKLKKFKGVYIKGMELSKNKGQVAKAIELLKQALALDKAIAGGAGKYRDEINEKLGKSYFVKGVDSHMNKQYPEAYKAFKNALKYSPSYDLAQKRLQELEKIAKKFYEEAYIIKSTNADEAVKKLNTVLQIVPPDHVYYGKAKRLKSSIQGPISGESGDDSGF